MFAAISIPPVSYTHLDVYKRQDIGCSGYKIDIGIVDTENTSNYQLGIICDGKNYKRTKTARDREIVQNNVLKALAL